MKKMILMLMAMVVVVTTIDADPVVGAYAYTNNLVVENVFYTGTAQKVFVTLAKEDGSGRKTFYFWNMDDLKLQVSMLLSAKSTGQRVTAYYQWASNTPDYTWNGGAVTANYGLVSFYIED